MAGRRFTSFRELFVESLAPFGRGVMLADIAPRMQMFNFGPISYGKLRRSPVLLAAGDVSVLREALSGTATAYDLAVGTYAPMFALPSRPDGHDPSVGEAALPGATPRGP